MCFLCSAHTPKAAFLGEPRGVTGGEEWPLPFLASFLSSSLPSPQRSVHSLKSRPVPEALLFLQIKNDSPKYRGSPLRSRRAPRTLPTQSLALIRMPVRSQPPYPSRPNQRHPFPCHTKKTRTAASPDPTPHLTIVTTKPQPPITAPAKSAASPSKSSPSPTAPTPQASSSSTPSAAKLTPIKPASLGQVSPPPPAAAPDQSQPSIQPSPFFFRPIFPSPAEPHSPSPIVSIKTPHLRSTSRIFHQNHHAK
jgi:hypothetical protein